MLAGIKLFTDNCTKSCYETTGRTCCSVLCPARLWTDKTRQCVMSNRQHFCENPEIDRFTRDLNCWLHGWKVDVRTYNENFNFEEQLKRNPHFVNNTVGNVSIFILSEAQTGTCKLLDADVSEIDWSINVKTLIAHAIAKGEMRVLDNWVPDTVILTHSDYNSHFGEMHGYVSYYKVSKASQKAIRAQLNGRSERGVGPEMMKKLVASGERTLRMQGDKGALARK